MFRAPQEREETIAAGGCLNHPGSRRVKSCFCVVPAYVLQSELLYLSSLLLTVIRNFDSFT